jgi:hypothetical protein
LLDSFAATIKARGSNGLGRLCAGLAIICLSGCIRHIAVAPKVPVPGWSSFKQGFDLIWNLEKGVDANGLPVNPRWAAQFSSPPGRPHFRDTCGPAFAPLGITINSAELTANCTSQGPVLDVRPQKISDPATLFLCPANPLRGHLNWGLVTYTGEIQYTGWSSDFWLLDDDINFTLFTPHDAGLTNLGKGLHLEFRSRETIDQFVNTPWWAKLDHEVHTGNPFLPSSLERVGQVVNGRFAVVTGLVGVDGVHGGYTESHPVYAMAVRTEQHPTGGGVEETWTFFLRNHGTEGDCSLMEHHWNDYHGSYYVQFPWPEKATDVSLAAVPGVWSYLSDGISGAKLEKSADCSLREGSEGCTFLRLDVPDSGLQIGAYGEIKFAYTLPANAPPVAPPPSPRAVTQTEFEGGMPDKVKKRLRSLGDSLEEIRKNLPRDLAAFEEKKPSVLRVAPSKKPVPVGTVITPHEWRYTAEKHEDKWTEPDFDDSGWKTGPADLRQWMIAPPSGAVTWPGSRAALVIRIVWSGPASTTGG